MALTPIQRFYNSITNPITRKNYEFQFNKFLEWGKFTPEAFKKMKKTERQDEVLQYIQSWKAKTEKWGSPAPSSYTPMISSIMSFCEANELDMNWKLIKKTIPKITQLSNQYPYLNEDVEKMISVAGNLRDVAFIHLMASTAPRIGEVNDIKIKDVTPIADGAILVMYAGQLAEYRVPMTPEAYGHLKNYLETRENKKPNSSLFATIGLTERPMKTDSVREFMKRFRDKIEKNEKDGKRKDKAPNNAFRKRLQICYSNAKVEPRYADYFLNHNLGKQDLYYFRKMTNEDIWEAFKPAIPCITLDKSLKIEAQKNEEIKIIKESHDVELREKLESQDELIQNLALSLASTKYLMYEKNYIDCYNHETHIPNLDELRKRMTPEEIQDWNSVVPLVNKPEYVIKYLNTSETRLKHIQEYKEWKALLENYKKQGLSKDKITNLEKMISDIVKEYDLDKNMY